MPIVLNLRAELRRLSDAELANLLQATWQAVDAAEPHWSCQFAGARFEPRAEPISDGFAISWMKWNTAWHNKKATRHDKGPGFRVGRVARGATTGHHGR